MKIGSTFNHELYGPLKITGKRYSRLGNKSLWIGTDEQGEEHELDGSEKPAKPEKSSPQFLKEASELLGMTQGPKGEDADEDYIIEAVIPRVLEQIRLPEDGAPGKDGADADVELVVREILPLVMERMPKPKEIDEVALIAKIMARIRIPLNGKDGENGKDGSPDTAPEIKEKLESLKGDDRLDARAIKNLPKPVMQIGGGDSYTGLAKVDSSDTPGTLESKIVAGSNITITKTNGTLSIAGSAGGSGSPGGSDTQVQFNDGGSFGGDAGLTYNKTTDALTIGGGLTVDTTTLVVDATNNSVGMGTTTPGGLLQISGTGTDTPLLGATAGTTSNALLNLSPSSDGIVRWGIRLGATAAFPLNIDYRDSASGTPTNLVQMTRTGLFGINGTPTAKLHVRESSDSASVQVAIFEGDRATPAANDNAYHSFLLSDSAGNRDEMVRMQWKATSVTSGSENGQLIFSVRTAGTLTEKLSLTGTILRPIGNDDLSLGSSGLAFSDLFLASGGVINFNAGNYTITHSAGLLTLNGALSIGTSNALTAGTIELGNASDTTISRSAAGVLAVEGVVIPSISSTNTITNKRNTRRLTTTNAPGATPTTNTDNVDVMNFTGLATAITSMTTNLSGTPVDGDLIEFRFTDDGTARGITWGASFAATTVALPTTTVISTMLRVGFEYSGSTWKCIATC